jgi:hypothetical protein
MQGGVSIWVSRGEFPWTVGKTCLGTVLQHMVKSNNKTSQAFCTWFLTLSFVLPRDIWSCNRVQKAPDSCVLPFRPERFHVMIKINEL